MSLGIALIRVAEVPRQFPEFHQFLTGELMELWELKELQEDRRSLVLESTEGMRTLDRQMMWFRWPPRA